MELLRWDVIISYLPLYRDAMFLTLRIGWAGILAAIGLGFVCALVRHYRIPVLKNIVGIYIELFRNTPLLVQLFFLYFGLPKIGLEIPAEPCGVLGLALLGGAYMAETFRSGVEAVEPIQMESALSLAFVANVIFLLKETSVFSAISLMDLMFTAKDLIGLYYKTLECLTLLVVFYLIILLPVSALGSFLERRLRYAGFGD